MDQIIVDWLQYSQKPNGFSRFSLFDPHKLNQTFFFFLMVKLIQTCPRNWRKITKKLLSTESFEAIDIPLQTLNSRTADIDNFLVDIGCIGTIAQDRDA